MEAVLLPVALAAPIAMLVVATRVRRAREARGAYAGASPRTHAKPWDKHLRNAMLLGISGVLLVPAGLYAFALLETRRYAPVFMVPVIAGVVLLTSAYRTWMRGVAQVPEENPETAAVEE